MSSLSVFLETVKISHTIFALPFALAAAFLAARGLPEPMLLVKIVLACVFARTAAMAFNRWADREIDRANPRTATRAIPAGLLSAKAVLGATIASSALFTLTAYWINPLAFRLSPIALIVLLGYSYTKRFTRASHLVLGAALGLSPLGAWIAVRGEFALLPVLLGVAVCLWTAGFDIIYACQDVEFDRGASLHSLPSRIGTARALLFSRLAHLATVALLATIALVEDLGTAYWIGVVIVAALLFYEQSLVRANNLSRVNLAFFTLNGCVSLAFMATTIAEVLVSKR